jgi:hypothetical protein
MTTYPLSELATIYAADDDSSQPDVVLGRGTLAECVDIIEGLPSEKRNAARIEMDGLDLRYGREEVEELIQFLRDESTGLSNQEISAIAEQDR